MTIPQYRFNKTKQHTHYVCMRLPFIPWSIAGVPSSQALPGFLITAPPSVCLSDVIGALAVWIQNQKEKRKKVHKPRKIAIIIPRRRTGTWKRVTVANQVGALCESVECEDIYSLSLLRYLSDAMCCSRSRTDNTSK